MFSSSNEPSLPDLTEASIPKAPRRPLKARGAVQSLAMSALVLSANMNETAGERRVGGIVGKETGPQRQERNPIAERVKELERENGQLQRRADLAAGIVETV